MAAHTKIIDLFGIPACGKTTLANYICERYGDSLRVTTIPKLVKETKNDRWRLMIANPFRNNLSAALLRMKAPLEEKRKDVAFWGWPSHDKYYAYAKKYADYDIVLADHGDIQSIVTLERGEDLHKDSKFLNACVSYLDKSLADAYVYCKIPPEVSLERMYRRGRDKGRIDIINNRDEKLNALKEEQTRFVFYEALLKEHGHICLELDMNNSTEMVSEDFLRLMRYGL